jgi:hypothetical protein
MKIAFTIILNGKIHLLHNNYYKTILEYFDYWVVVEGASKNTGSTSWCKPISCQHQNNGHSVDGTVEFLYELKGQYKNIIPIFSEGLWCNKDSQVNTAIARIKEITKECTLWEIDADEQWKPEQWNHAESILKEENAKTGCFLCNHYVGKNLIAVGEWGEGRKLPYRRLWHWKDEFFESHEPPRLSGGNGLGILIPIKFNHYSLYFDKDVQFKEEFYNYTGLYQRWKDLQNMKEFPQHISKLLGTDTHWGHTNTLIIKKE